MQTPSRDWTCCRDVTAGRALRANYTRRLYTFLLRRASLHRRANSAGGELEIVPSVAAAATFIFIKESQLLVLESWSDALTRSLHHASVKTSLCRCVNHQRLDYNFKSKN